MSHAFEEDLRWVQLETFVIFWTYRAMAGGKSIGENYAFAGMHHIFDQHRQAGKRTQRTIIDQ